MNDITCYDCGRTDLNETQIYSHECTFELCCGAATLTNRYSERCRAPRSKTYVDGCCLRHSSDPLAVALRNRNAKRKNLTNIRCQEKADHSSLPPLWAMSTFTQWYIHEVADVLAAS